MLYTFDMNKVKIQPYIPFLIFFVLVFILLQPIILILSSDDGAHFEMLEKLGISGWVLWRAEEWQPRLFSDYFYAIFIQNIALWKFVNAVIAGLLVFGIWRTACGPSSFEDYEDNTRRKNLVLIASLICVLFFLIYPNAVTSSVFWYTGSFNYLWPVTAMLFGLMPFIFLIKGESPYPKKVWIPIGIFASICAGFNEQTTAVALGVSLLILIYCLIKKRKIPKLLFVHFAIIAICAIYFLYSVFFSSRLAGGSEIALFPEYAEFGLRHKLMLGVNVMTNHLLRSSSLLFFVFAMLAGILAAVRLKGKNIIVRMLSFLPAFYILLNIVPFRFVLSGTWNHPEKYTGILGVDSAFETEPSWFDFLHRVIPLNWGPTERDTFMAILALIIVLLVLYPLFFAFKKISTRLLASLLYLAALASGAIMGFSPTVFASGSRPYFLANVILLLLCAMLLKEGLSEKTSPVANDFTGATNRSKVFIGIISLIAVYSIFMYKFIFASSYYWLF